MENRTPRKQRRLEAVAARRLRYRRRKASARRRAAQLHKISGDPNVKASTWTEYVEMMLGSVKVVRT